MRCEACGKETTHTINQMCVDCYINNNIPSKVTDIPWIFYYPYSGTNWKKSELHIDEELASKIIEGKNGLDRDNSSIKIGKMVVPLTVEALDDLAMRTGILTGKWLIYRNELKIDDIWKCIARVLFEKKLGFSAKVSTAFQKKKSYVVCIYTYNYLDQEDVYRVRGKLREIGITERLCYKPDIYTYLNIYSGVTTLSPCRYRE